MIQLHVDGTCLDDPGDTAEAFAEHFDVDALFLIHVFLGSKFCPSLLDNISLSVLTCNVRSHNQFFASCKNCPSARCTAAANLLCCDIEILCKDIMRDIKELN
jgi:hypothetical protein